MHPTRQADYRNTPIVFSVLYILSIIYSQYYISVSIIRHPHQSSGAVWKWRWPSWAPPSLIIPMVSVDVKQHWTWTASTKIKVTYSFQPGVYIMLPFWVPDVQPRSHTDNPVLSFVLFPISTPTPLPPPSPGQMSLVTVGENLHFITLVNKASSNDIPLRTFCCMVLKKPALCSWQT